MKIISIIMSSAVFIFILAMIGEWYYSKKKGLKLYDPGDTYANLGAGIIQQIFSIFTKTAHLGIYTFILTNFKVIDYNYPKWLSYLLAFILVDLGYYWAHRSGHRIAFLWATHIVHHQSEYYNFSVALRQSAVTVISFLPFFMPIAILGIGITEYVVATLFTSLYQFWIHTQTINNLGFFEEIFNTPSHHRVHHGINPKYLDKNYGATLIIWDKLFGTFAREDEKVSYGVTHTFASFNPILANLVHWKEIWANALSDSRIRYNSNGKNPKFVSILRALIAPPDWAPGSKLSWKSSDVSAVKFIPNDPRLAWWNPGQESILNFMGVIVGISIAGTVMILLKGPQMESYLLLGLCIIICILLYLPSFKTRKYLLK